MQTPPASMKLNRASTISPLRIVDACLLAVVCIMPLLLGGRYAIGRFALVAVAATAAIAWVWHHVRSENSSWRRSWALWMFAAASIIAALQLLPLPHSIVQQLHPSLNELFPLWHSSEQATALLGSLNNVSFYPHVTALGLAMLVAYAAIFFVTLQRLDRIEQVETTLRWVAWAAVGMASIGLAQYVADNGKFLWVYEHPFRDPAGSVTGAFDNNNHFAHFLALGIGPLVWLLVQSLGGRGGSSLRNKGTDFSSYRDWRTFATSPYTLLVCMGLVLFAAVTSTSRGGALVTVIALTVAVVGLLRIGLLPKKMGATIAGAVVVVVAALAIHGMNTLSSNVADFTAGSVEQLDDKAMRRTIWSANLAAWKDNPILGTGVGTHRYVMPIYLQQSYPFEFSHAESGYLQILSETGIAGAIVLLCSLLLCGAWCFRGLWHATSSRHCAASLAVTASLIASIVHSVWDFVWYIPGLMAITCVLAACACRMASLTTPLANTEASTPAIQRGGWPSIIRWPVFAATSLAGLWASALWAGPAMASGSWDDYLHQSVLAQGRLQAIKQDTSLSQEQRFNRRVMQTDAMIAHLAEALQRDRHNHRFHLRMASKLLVRYELSLATAPNQMPLNQLRDAALASQFQSREQLHGWIERAVGKESKRYLDWALHHLHAALAQTPLEPEGYLLLTDVAFLEGAGPQFAADCVTQALKADPHDGDTLIRAGTNAWLAGEVAAAMNYWKTANDTTSTYQRKLISVLAGLMPVQAYLASFEPDLDALPLLEARYTQLANEAELAIVRQYGARQSVTAAQQAQKDEDANAAGNLWLQALVYYRKLDALQPAAKCGRQAVKLQPQDYKTRLTVGQLMLKSGHFADAETHLRWCLDRRPDDARLQQQAQEAMAGRMRTASPGNLLPDQATR